MGRQLRYPIGLSILFLALFVLSERTFSPIFQKCIAQEKQDKNADSTKDDPTIFNVSGAYVRCSGSFVEAHGSGITALATIIIAAFTGTLWIATSRQARLTQEALIADKRAFIFADSFFQYWEPLGSIAGQYNWRFRPRWRNVGQTPTRDLKVFVECEIRNTPLPQGYAFECDQSQAAKGIIAPQADTSGGIAPKGAAITPQDIFDAQAFKKFIYLWGWVRYFDVFPQTPKHITHFCWLITIAGNPLTFIPNTPGQPPTPGTLSFSYLQHTEGNYAEDEESRQRPRDKTIA